MSKWYWNIKRDIYDDWWHNMFEWCHTARSISLNVLKNMSPPSVCKNMASMRYIIDINKCAVFRQSGSCLNSSPFCGWTLAIYYFKSRKYCRIICDGWWRSTITRSRHNIEWYRIRPWVRSLHEIKGQWRWRWSVLRINSQLLEQIPWRQ